MGASISTVENTSDSTTSSCFPSGEVTGRLLLRRAGIRADWGAIFRFCAENNKFLEVNASPHRLDLSDEHIQLALQAGAKLIISTDAHSATGLEDMRYGVWQARRGWAQKHHILNTRSYAKVCQARGIKM